MATTEYTITGKSTIKPENLPEGFTVKQETKKMTDLRLESIYGRPIAFAQYSDSPGRASWSIEVGGYVALMTDADAAKLREFLDDNFPDTEKVWKITDNDWDVWFEMPNGKFSMAKGWQNKSYESAVDRHHEDGFDSLASKTREQIDAHHGILKEETVDIRN